MTDIFLDDLLTVAEPFSIYIEDQTDTSDSNELKDYIPATLDYLYLRETAIETTKLRIFSDSIRATSGGVPIKGYYYNFFGALQVAGNIPNLLLDLSNPISHYLRSF